MLVDHLFTASISGGGRLTGRFTRSGLINRSSPRGTVFDSPSLRHLRSPLYHQIHSMAQAVSASREGKSLLQRSTLKEQLSTLLAHICKSLDVRAVTIFREQEYRDTCLSS